jgi:hypothetical protein
MSAAAHLPHVWTRHEYERLVDAGVFHPDFRLERVDGEILDRPTQRSRHATALQLAGDALRGAFDRGFSIRSQMPLAIDGYSEPEPDIAVVSGDPRDYSGAHPGDGGTRRRRGRGLAGARPLLGGPIFGDGILICTATAIRATSSRSSHGRQ